MFERFTEPARLVVGQAQVAARELRHDQVGTEHILLGLVRVESRAAAALGLLGADRRQVEQRVVAIVSLGEEAPDDHEDTREDGEEDAIAGPTIPFAPRAQRVLERSFREALSLGTRQVEPQHILLGLERENEGVAAQVLRDLGIGRGALRAAMPELFRGPVPGVIVDRGVPPRVRKVLPEEPELPPSAQSIGGGVIESGFELGWRERPVTLAALGAAALTRRAFDPLRTGMLDPIEMQILVFLTLEGRGDPGGAEAVNVESLTVALACDPPVLQTGIAALAASELVVVMPDGQSGTGVAITRAGADRVEAWLRLVAPLFEGWPPDHPGVDDATG